MERQRSDPRRVVETPKRRVLPYFLVATVAAIAVWSMQQQSIPDAGEATGAFDGPVTQPRTSEPDSNEAHSAKGDLRALFSADDYPVAAQAKEEQGTVQATLTVDTTGRVSKCTIVRSSGYASLDQATCSILQRRAHFIPARDASGALVADNVTTPPIVWRLEG